jgi:hypothetical protein
MPSAGWIRIVIVLAAGAMFALSALTGDSIDASGLRWLGAVTSGVTLAVLAFDRWLWRWPLVRWITELAGARVIRGTWRGVLRYTRDETGTPGEQSVFMAIDQTYSAVSIRCYFPAKRSESWSLTAAIERESHRHALRYIYQQQAQAPDRDVNRPTQGACELILVGRPVEQISGSYYAERGGKGTIAFDGRCRKVAGSGEQAARLEYDPLPR